METVNISELRSNLLNYLKKVKDGNEITITSHGEALATIVPPVDQNQQARAKLKQLAKTAIVKDVVGSIEDDWDVLS